MLSSKHGASTVLAAWLSIACDGAAEQADGALPDGPSSDARVADAAPPDGAPSDAGPWSLQAVLQPDDSRPVDTFGFRVAIDGDVAAVWRPPMPAQPPVVFVFRRDREVVREIDMWRQEARLVLAEEPCGAALAVAEETLFVGCPGGPENSAVYVFSRTESVWSLSERIAVPGADRFGASVASDGQRLAVGAPGLVYVYARAGGDWKLEDVLGPVDDTQMGERVSIDGDTLVAGAQNAVHVFARSGDDWTEEARLAPLGRGDLWQTEISGDRIIVGAACVLGCGGPDPSCVGAAYMYRRERGAWIEEVQLDPDERAAPLFGCRVRLAGTTALVYGCREGDLQRALVFRRAGTTWHRADAIEWQAGNYSDLDLARSGDRAIFGGFTDPGRTGAAFVYAR